MFSCEAKILLLKTLENCGHGSITTSDFPDLLVHSHVNNALTTSLESFSYLMKHS